jgi:hypothetical protein
VQKTSYHIERLSTENIHLLAPLYFQVFKKKVHPAFFIKKYSTGNWGVEHIGFIAFTKENLPAAFYGVIPCTLLIESLEVLAAQSADTMTHENHRNRGLFIQLALKTYELARENNIKFIFGFPNQNSYPGLVKLNWQFSRERLKLFKMKASRFPFAKIFLRIEALSIMYKKAAKRFLSNENVKETIFSLKDSNCVKHDQLFMEYKAYSETVYTRFDAGIDLWIKIDGTLKIGFVNFHKNIDGFEFIKTITRLATFLGCSEVSFITHKNSSLYNALHTIIQPVDSLPIGFYNLTNEMYQFDKIGFEYCDIDIF